MLLKPSWSFFNKKGNKRRIQKKGQHLLLSLPMRRRETGNTFRIQKKGRDNNKYQIVDLIEPSQQIFDLIPFVILCADCIPSAHTAVVILSPHRKQAPHTKTNWRSLRIGKDKRGFFFFCLSLCPKGFFFCLKKIIQRKEKKN